MKLSSVRYLTREGFRSIWQNRFMALASVGVLISCLLLTGGAYLVFKNIDHMFDWMNGQNVVAVFAEESCDDEQVTALGEKIRSLSNVESVELITKEESLEKYGDSLPEALFEEYKNGDNPFLDSFVVTFKDLSLFDETVTQLEAIEHVDSVEQDGGIAEMLLKVRHIVLIAGGWIIGMLLLVSLFIIANTIKLTVYSRRLEISIMKAVGATNAFVRMPFVIEGMVLGLVAGGVSYGLLYLVYDKLGDFLMDSMTGALQVGTVPFVSMWWQLLVAFLCGGMLVGMLGSAISMRKYLKEAGGGLDD